MRTPHGTPQFDAGKAHSATIPRSSLRGASLHAIIKGGHFESDTDISNKGFKHIPEPVHDLYNFFSIAATSRKSVICFIVDVGSLFS